MTEQDEALKRLAVSAMDGVIRSGGWDGTVEAAEHLTIDEAFIKSCSPTAILGILARLEAAERDAETYRHMSKVTKAAGYDSITEALVALDRAAVDAARYRMARKRGIVSLGHESGIDAELAKERG